MGVFIMINEMQEYNDYMDFTSDCKNSRLKMRTSSKNAHLVGHNRALTIIARYSAFDNPEIKDLPIDIKIEKTKQAMENWFTEYTKKYVDKNLTQAKIDNSFNSIFENEEPEKDNKSLIPNKAILNKSNAETYKSIIIKGLAEGPLSKDGKIYLSSNDLSTLEKIKYSTKKEPQLKFSGLIMQSKLIAAIAYYSHICQKQHKIPGTDYIEFNRTNFGNWISSQSGNDTDFIQLFIDERFLIDGISVVNKIKDENYDKTLIRICPSVLFDGNENNYVLIAEDTGVGFLAAIKEQLKNYTSSK